MLTIILIAAIFYIPFHLGPPVLLAMLYGRDAKQRKDNVQEIVIESVLTMVVALGAFFWLWQQHLLTAVIVMLIMMALPYWRIWKFRQLALERADRV